MSFTQASKQNKMDLNGIITYFIYSLEITKLKFSNIYVLKYLYRDKCFG